MMKLLRSLLLLLVAQSAFAAPILVNGTLKANGPFASSNDTNALNSATTIVDVSGSAAPTVGKILTAVDSTHATWQLPAASGHIIQSAGVDQTTRGHLNFTSAFTLSDSSGSDRTSIDVATGGISSAMLASTAVSAANYGDATHVGAFTVDAKGRLTAASSTAITGLAESAITGLVSDLAGKQATGNYITALTGDGTASGPGSVAFTLANTAATPGSFGSATASATYTVDAKGRLTASGSTAIQLSSSAFVTGLDTALALLATDSLVLHRAGTESVTGAKTFNDTTLVLNNSAATFTTTLATAAATSSKVWTLPNLTATAAQITSAQTFAGTQTFSGAINANGNVQRGSAGSMSIGTTSNTTSQTLGSSTFDSTALLMRAQTIDIQIGTSGNNASIFSATSGRDVLMPVTSFKLRTGGADNITAGVGHVSNFSLGTNAEISYIQANNKTIVGSTADTIQIADNATVVAILGNSPQAGKHIELSGLVHNIDGRRFNAVIKSGTSGTMTVNSHVAGISSSGAFALSIPGAASSGTVYYIYDHDNNAATNNITITPASGLCNGSATCVISKNKGWLFLMSDGTDYEVLGSSDALTAVSLATPYMDLAETTAPSTPSAGHIRFYAKSNGVASPGHKTQFVIKDDQAAETVIYESTVN